MLEKSPIPEPRQKIDREDVVRKTSVNTVVSAKDLSLLEDAGAKTGYTVSVIAREGQDYTYWIEKHKGEEGRRERERIIRRGENVQVTRKLTPGEVAISIKAPEGRTDYTPFWHTFNTLKSTPTKRKS